MKFPDAERVRYKQNALAEVICQLRFKRLLKIESDLPSMFQDKIRKATPTREKPRRFPRFPPS